MNILVVDDHDVMRSMLKDVLETEGHRVLAAAHGTDAVALLNDHAVNLIISDILIPETDCLDFFLKVRSRHLPIIAMSGLDGDYVMNDLLSTFGVCAFLHKPFSLSELIETIERFSSFSFPDSPLPGKN